VNTSWRLVYSGKTLSQLQWFSVLGEAEKAGEVHAVLTLAQTDPRFVLDAPYYDRVFIAMNGEFSLHIMFLDTTALLRTKKKQNDEQLVWLANTLAESNTTMRLVVGFHTPFSDPTLTSFLVPILEGNGADKKGATAYFSGRELSLQWFKGKNTHYFISGGGAENLKNENPFLEPLFVSPTSGFLACAAGFQEKTNIPRLKTAIVSNVGEVYELVDTALT